jgi:hypothetical protein
MLNVAPTQLKKRHKDTPKTRKIQLNVTIQLQGIDPQTNSMALDKEHGTNNGVKQ